MITRTQIIEKLTEKLKPLWYISHHIPDGKLKRLEYFTQITSLDAMENRIPEAEVWFKEMIKELENKFQ